ncbi:ribosome assembly protein SQT1 [Sporothrix brasiliensis 5110]|uniref:Ribosome assembly protein SQT1 n=1 Tax=Sporothrix brasiliensis 5110 TaxID=1398154 RepID=A0A0C2J424_9PEZI|nr:ribosome assembly protein SQT1 [Sporothrix brasiliensis 5110]KIH93750.1 ribosome assembly protein SQT1 [Sporothrix brasiliensis 5110]
MSHNARDEHPTEDDGDDSGPEMLDMDDAAEEIDGDDGADGGDDVAMDSGDDDDDEELVLVNDSIAYFDLHKDSVFAIAQHPKYPSLVATGGSEGEGETAPGKGYVIDTSAAADRPLLPASYSSDPSAAANQPSSTELAPLFEMTGHTDSINALTFTLPNGDFLVSGGMDGRMRVYSVAVGGGSVQFQFVGESQEVPEINWLAPCPGRDYPNTVALGASDGSVWVLSIDPSADPASPIQIVQSFFSHTAACTAGTWTADGNLLATVSEDSSLQVWDVWGVAAGRGLVPGGAQALLSLTGEDQRFEVPGGLYSVAVSPGGTLVAVGGAGGVIKVVTLPRLTGAQAAGTAKKGAAGGGAKQKGAARPTPAGQGSGAAATDPAQFGTILASLEVQSDGIETLAFAPPPMTLLAAGSVDGSIAVFDVTRSFALRRHIRLAHDDFSVVKVEWVKSAPASLTGGVAAGVGGPAQWLLTSIGMDGVVRRWDLRKNVTPDKPGDNGMVKEWRGHRGDGEGGGVLGFVQGDTGERITTAGDDGVVLVFDA